MRLLLNLPSQNSFQMNTKVWSCCMTILRHRQIPVNKKDMTWNWTFNMPCKSLKGILVLFEEEKPSARDTSKFYNPKIQKVSVIVEGKPNQLYAQEMRSFEQYDEAHKYFTEGVQRDSNVNEVQKQLQLYYLSLGEYLVNKKLYRAFRQQGNRLTLNTLIFQGLLRVNRKVERCTKLTN